MKGQRNESGMEERENALRERFIFLRNSAQARIQVTDIFVYETHTQKKGKWRKASENGKI